MSEARLIEVLGNVTTITVPYGAPGKGIAIKVELPNTVENRLLLASLEGGTVKVTGCQTELPDGTTMHNSAVHDQSDLFGDEQDNEQEEEAA